MFPVNCVIKYGVITNNIYGRVILKKVWTALAPSIFAASYNSAGIFCKIPVTWRIVYGIPTHRLITITVTLAHIALVKNGNAVSIIPYFISSVLTIPVGCNILLIIRRDTNCGTAMDNTKQNLQNPFALVSFRLIMIARIIPKI